MANTTDTQLACNTVPFHFRHSHNPLGSYSQITGRLGLFESAHFVKRFSRLLRHPTLEGMPSPCSTSDFFVYNANCGLRIFFLFDNTRSKDNDGSFLGCRIKASTPLRLVERKKSIRRIPFIVKNIVERIILILGNPASPKFIFDYCIFVNCETHAFLSNRVQHYFLVSQLACCSGRCEDSPHNNC